MKTLKDSKIKKVIKENRIYFASHYKCKNKYAIKKV